MSRPIKKSVHIFFPEADCRGDKIKLSEDFYLKYSFRRNIPVILKTYGYDHEKNFNSAYQKNEYNDQCFIVMDTDITATRDNINAVKKNIGDYQKKYPRAKMILSSRSFETWLCMYNHDTYTKPFTDKSQLLKDTKFSGYDKQEVWFREHATELFENYQNAKQASIKSRKLVFSSNNLEGLNLESHPGKFDDRLLHIIVPVTPYTFFDILIDELME